MLARMSRGQGFFKNSAAVGLAVFALTGATTIAQANSYSISVYQGTGPGCSTGPCQLDPRVNADSSNPLITPADLLGSGTYNTIGTAPINFITTTTNTIGAFLNSGGGVLSAGLLTPAVQNAVASTGPMEITTVLVITSISAGLNDGIITHDDGISLYTGTGLGPTPYPTLLVGAPLPTTADSTPYSGLNGPWELVYVEANGLPAQLTWDVTSGNQSSDVPLPAALPLFATGLGALGLLGRRRKRKNAAAVAA